MRIIQETSRKNTPRINRAISVVNMLLLLHTKKERRHARRVERATFLNPVPYITFAYLTATYVGTLAPRNSLANLN